jgi:hypothetical protein
MAASKARIGVPLKQWLLTTLITPFFGTAGLIERCEGSGVGAVVLVAQSVGWTQPRLVLLQPGTRIKDKPPEGWNHLVIKSIPRLASGDRDSLPAVATKTATLFRTVVLADVRPVDLNEKEFVLARIGVGMCLPDDDGQRHDVVVSSDRLDALGIHLSTVERTVLDLAEAELAEGRIIVRTPTFALYRTPANLVVAGKHRQVDLYYAFCVERATGRLRVAVWTMWPGQGIQAPPPALVELAANTVFDCAIDVRAKRILGAIPISWSFAMRSLPPGFSVRVPPRLGELITATTRRPSGVDGEELERMLVRILFMAPDANKAGYQTMSPPPYRTSGN